MPNVTVVDTSCLILLDKINQLHLLRKLFDNVTVTHTVSNEFSKSIPEWINITKADPQETRTLAGFLDLGEASSIAYALSNKNSLLIIDERKGRKVAKEMGLQITGSLGILITAKQGGHIQAVKPIINQIQQTSFRISSNLIEYVLKKANEF